MPSKTTPPKHQTPNWKLVTYLLGTLQVSVWEAVPLRADRKDTQPYGN